MKTDARVRYTKMIIQQSFVEQLKVYPLNKITVKKICATAEINRATFYKHYHDCYDLMKQMEDKLIIDLKELIFESRDQNLENIFGKILEKFKEKKELYLVLFSENGDSTFPAKIFELCYDLAVKNNKKKEITQEWLYYFLAYGCSGVLNRWISSGMKEDIYEVSAFIGNISEKVLK
ncbi:TetR-like C-terminal domain-containing protein [Lactobacillus sp. UCMA15818]|uniref:TetR/AcrR family transcriptional regulator n=1 Tax=Lactobacillus sp. UCMA15818 TaxID=2583394 RepID=UPI0025B21EF1|nr:TetR-like C-terminal domain-containing protein [Lactobacillus sp. UCMA15818]MDN2454107.1 TetR/AcrR family transcriptional regulator [Lactobacillus sp. UCMA15818]